MFLAKEFVSFEFKDLSPEQEEDLFARVQMGVQLSLAEKMRASTGPWQELARLYVEDFPNVYALMKDRARAKDFQLTLSCFSQVLEVMHPAAADGIPILRTNHSALPKLLNNKGAVDDGLKSHLASVWNTLKDLIEQDPDTFTNANKYLRGVQTFAPVEMVAVTVLISQYSATRNKRLLVGDIKDMREAIRERFVDLRLNTPLWKFIWDYIENLGAIRGAVNGTTVHKTQTLSVTAPATGIPSASAPAQKPTEKGKTMAKGKAPESNVPQVLPPHEPFTFKREEDNTSSSSDVRKRKRQHTESKTNSTSTAGVLTPHSPFQLIPFRSATPSTMAPPSRSTTVADASPGPQAGPSTWAAIAEANAFSRLSSPTLSRKPQDSVRVAPVLTDSRQASAPMISVAPQLSGSPRFPPAQPAASLSLGGSRPHLISNRKLSQHVQVTPDHAQKQWQESREETEQAGPSSISSAKHRMQKAHRTAPQALSPQLDDLVDLTSDTEQEEERQNLLTSFGARVLADRDGRTKKTVAAATNTTQFPPTGGKRQTQKPAAAGNNPYARLAQGANTS